MPTAPTGTAGTLARVTHYQVIHFLRVNVTSADAAKTVVVGVLPANSLIIRELSGVQVDTAFNAGTTNTIDIGFTGSLTAFGSALSSAAAVKVPIGATTGLLPTTETTVIATLNNTGTAATLGKATILIAYAPDL